MSELNKTYRIKTDIGSLLKSDYITIDANLVQDYDTFDILSVKIKSVDSYQLHNADYGVVVGRVLANNGFGIPNAKLSIFISRDSEDGEKIRELYPFTSIASRNNKGVRYNLLPDEMVDDCHQIVGTFPNKRYTLDDDIVLEVFDKYYKYTTRTNNSGDYLIMGVPVGTHNLHMDLDLSDCGILSQRPRDFVYKGYTVEQFENPNQFKDGTDYENLSQIISQNQVVNVQPFWGNSSLGSQIGITRADINVAFKFEPTCVFMGSIISDNSSQGISKKCIPTEGMGNMEELTTGEGTIEMIRKTMGGSIEELQIKGNQLINSNGIWCYQIPMNLDYMMTDEYGNMVPTDNPDIGIPTRACVRFRISMHDTDENLDNFFRAKALVPHNPQILEGSDYEDYDYEFGSKTRDGSFRDLFWNNVYSVKSYIPRFQKRKVSGWKEKKFTGIKNCNFFGSNNPFPYNNIRIKLPFMFTVMCTLIKVFIVIISLFNFLVSKIGNFLADLGDTHVGWPGKYLFGKELCWWVFPNAYKIAQKLSLTVLKEGLCPDLENWFFSPMLGGKLWVPDSPPPKGKTYNLLAQTLDKIKETTNDDDQTSIDIQNDEEMDTDETVCLTVHTDYLMHCVEMNLAMEYRVINFDFYNDWINGTIYFPRFMRYVRPKKTFLGMTFLRAKVKGCMDDTSIFSKSRRYTQQCSIGYKTGNINGKFLYANVDKPKLNKDSDIRKSNNLHKKRGFTQAKIFEKNGGICHEHTTLKGQHVYYMKPCEWVGNNKSKCTLFATDLILLGSLNNCDLYGIPQAFKYLSSTSYIMPTNLALTNMESSGPLYTNNGTLCDGQNSIASKDVENGAKVSVLPPSCGMTAELRAFNDTNSDTYDTMYDRELSDIIPLTEIAGISWSYTGPGQGEISKAKMYYPGGHFLGLSCVNSQSNLKSCINLSRICEVGANMSQRQEDIKSYSNEGNVEYIYTAPTGFISGNELVGSDFRTMFATMNQKQLKATKTLKTNGYKIYDMTFVKPINFNGSFSKLTTGANNPYNKEITVYNENDDVLISYGILREGPDYDVNEYTNTQTRTIEDISVDYYRFRYGLDVLDLNRNSNKQSRKFLLEKDGAYYLPQYENSFYFYFGIKNGGTALDEFNKQFFSDCGNSMLTSAEPSISIISDNNYDDENDVNSDIIVTIENLEIPYKFIEIKSDVNFIGNKEKKNTLLIKNGDVETEYDEWLKRYNFTLEDCPVGTYTVTVRDANDVILSKTEKIGEDLFKYEINVFNFNAKVDKSWQSNTPIYNYGGESIHKGGYIKIDNINIKNLNRFSASTQIFIGAILKYSEDKNWSNYNYSTRSEGFNYDYENITNNNAILTVDIPGIYDVYISYTVKPPLVYGSYSPDNYKVSRYIGEIEIKDTSYLSLEIGASLKTASMSMSISDYNYNWWDDKLNKNDMTWYEEAAFFNTNANKNDAFSIGIMANNGTKVVWGLAQQMESGFYTEEIYCTETPEEIENEYMLDDEYVYHSSYKNKDEIFNCYSALVYKGTDVMGGYDAYLKDGKIYKNDNTEWNPKNNGLFTSGCGYIFKPLPEGDLQFHVLKGGNLNYESMDGTITNGLFYPSIPFHTFDRPFYAKTNYFCWAQTYLIIDINDNGEPDITLTSREKTGRCEMKIYNGKTYDSKFHSTSTISMLENLNYTINEKNNDSYGIKDREDRIVEIKGYYKNSFSSSTDDFSSYYYEITEGTPNEKNNHFLKRALTISDYVQPDFVETLSYVDNGSSVELVYDEDNNSQAEYKICRYYDDNGSESLIKSVGSKYIYGIVTGEPNICYVLGVYTDKAIYNIKGNYCYINIILNAEEEEVQYSYYINNEDNISEKRNNKIEWNKNYVQQDGVSFNTTYIDTIFSKIFSAISKYGIEAVKEYCINSGCTDWSGEIYGKTGGTLYYAVGEVCGNTENTKLYKIYPFIKKVSSAPKISANFNINGKKSITTEFTCNGGTEILNLKAPNGVEWKGMFEGGENNWITINPLTGNGSSKIDVKVNENYGAEREQDITFAVTDTTEGSYENITYKIKQEAKTNLSFTDEYGNNAQVNTDIVFLYQYEDQSVKDYPFYIKGIFNTELDNNFDDTIIGIVDEGVNEYNVRKIIIRIHAPNSPGYDKTTVITFKEKDTGKSISITITVSDNFDKYDG